MPDPPTFDLTDLRALVTGGGSGIGKAIARALVRAGVSVVICGRRLEPLEATAKELEEFGDIRYVQYDVTNPVEDIPNFVAEVGAIDILVNNAGGVVRTPWEQLTSQNVREAMLIHVEAPLRLCQAFVPGMEKRKFGRIVNVVSIWGSRVQNQSLYPGIGVDVAPYCMSKHALLGLTRYLASILGRKGVTVNAVSPGPVRVERNEGFFVEKVSRALSDSAPVGRLGVPDDIGAAVAFLASRDAAFITGQDLVVDGGAGIW